MGATCVKGNSIGTNMNITMDKSNGKIVTQNILNHSGSEQSSTSDSNEPGSGRLTTHTKHFQLSSNQPLSGSYASESKVKDTINQFYNEHVMGESNQTQIHRNRSPDETINGSNLSGRTAWVTEQQKERKSELHQKAKELENSASLSIRVSEFRELEGEFQSYINELERKIETKDETIQQWQTKFHELNKENVKLKGANKELSEQLSKEIGNKISRDESNLENVSVKNRPLRISEDYNNFCSDAWLNAKEYLDDNYTTDELIKADILTNILMKIQSELTKLNKVVIDEIKTKLNNPFQTSEYYTRKKETDVLEETNFDGEIDIVEETRKTNKHQQKLEDTVNILTDYYRITADEVNFENLTKDMTDKLRDCEELKLSDLEGIKVQSALHKDPIKCYVRESCKLIWKMIIQRPAMTLKTPGIEELVDDNLQKYAFDTNPKLTRPGKAIVKVYQHPVLYHGATLMCKGTVIVKKKPKNQKIN